MASRYNISPQLRQWIEEEAERNNIDPLLLEALVIKESGGDPNAVSPKGALGPAQVMPPTAKDPGYEVKPFDPNAPNPVQENIRISSDYLSATMTAFNDQLDDGLNAYNAGIRGWTEMKEGKRPIPEETKNYAPGIKEIYKQLVRERRDMEGEAAPISRTAPLAGTESPPPQYDAQDRALMKKPGSPFKYEEATGGARVADEAGWLAREVGAGLLDTGAIIADLADFGAFDDGVSDRFADWLNKKAESLRANATPWIAERRAQSIFIDDGEGGIKFNPDASIGRALIGTIAGSIAPGGAIGMGGKALLGGFKAFSKYQKGVKAFMASNAGRRLTPAAAYGLSNSAYIGMDTYRDTYQEAVAGGSAPEEAEKIASKAGWTAAGIAAVTGGIGGMGLGETGNMARRVGVSTLLGGLTEAPEEIGQYAAGRWAQGLPLEPRRMAEAGFLGLIAGGPTEGVMAALTGPAPDPLDGLAPPTNAIRKGLRDMESALQTRQIAQDATKAVLRTAIEEGASDADDVLQRAGARPLMPPTTPGEPPAGGGGGGSIYETPVAFMRRPPEGPSGPIDMGEQAQRRVAFISQRLDALVQAQEAFVQQNVDLASMTPQQRQLRESTQTTRLRQIEDLTARLNEARKHAAQLEIAGGPFPGPQTAQPSGAPTSDANVTPIWQKPSGPEPTFQQVLDTAVRDLSNLTGTRPVSKEEEKQKRREAMMREQGETMQQEPEPEGTYDPLPTPEAVRASVDERVTKLDAQLGEAIEAHGQGLKEDREIDWDVMTPQKKEERRAERVYQRKRIEAIESRLTAARKQAARLQTTDRPPQPSYRPPANAREATLEEAKQKALDLWRLRGAYAASVETAVPGQHHTRGLGPEQIKAMKAHFVERLEEVDAQFKVARQKVHDLERRAGIQPVKPKPSDDGAPPAHRRLSESEPADLQTSAPGAAPGYLYHATNQQNLWDIADSGTLDVFEPSYGTEQSAWPDGEAAKRSYWGATPEGVKPFAPAEGSSVVVRAKRESGSFQRESGTSDFYNQGPIPTEKLEYFGADGAWHPVSALRAEGVPAVEEAPPAEEEAPPSARLSPERVDYLIREYGYASGRVIAGVATVNPRAFLWANTPNGSAVGDIMEEAGTLDPQRLRNERQTPFIQIRKLDRGYEIIGHEGRHRMAALAKAGVTEVPVVIIDRENDGEAMVIPAEGTVLAESYMGYPERPPLQYRNLVDISYANREELNRVHGNAKPSDIAFMTRPEEGREDDIYTAPFHSQLYETVMHAQGMPKRGTSKVFREWLDGQQRQGNLKQEERDWMGVDEWLDGQQAVTRGALQKFVKQHLVVVREEQEAQYGEHKGLQIPGGTNYRELLFSIPYNRGLFTEAHFGKENVFAHVRFTERIDADGKRVLFVEEVQSDWHQRGRKYGYGPQTIYYVEDRFGAILAEFTNEAAARDAARILSIKDGDIRTVRAGRDTTGLADGVADAPFKKTWPLLVMKRMIRWAAENGFDRVAWTTGDTQARRYGQRHTVDQLVLIHDAANADTEADASGSLMGLDNAGREVFGYAIHSRAELVDYIGEESAAELLNQEPRPDNEWNPRSPWRRELNREGMTFGGQGMEGFYDRMLPSMVNNYVKKWGAKVQPGQTPVPHKSKNELVEPILFLEFPGEANPYDRLSPNGKRAIDKAFEEQVKTRETHSLDITNEMRNSIEETGTDPMFARPPAAEGEDAAPASWEATAALNKSVASNSVVPMLDHIASNSKDHSYRALAERLKKALTGRKVKVKVFSDYYEFRYALQRDIKYEPEERVDGVYVKENNTMYLRGDRFTSGAYTEELVLHEGIHGTLRGWMLENPDHPLTQDYNEIFDAVFEYLQDQILDGKGDNDPIVVQQLLDVMMEHHEELMTYGLTSRQVRAILKKVDMQGKSAWTRFTDWVAAILGVPNNSALKRLLDNADLMFAAIEAETAQTAQTAAGGAPTTRPPAATAPPTPTPAAGAPTAGRKFFGTKWNAYDGTGAHVHASSLKALAAALGGVTRVKTPAGNYILTAKNGTAWHTYGPKQGALAQQQGHYNPALPAAPRAPRAPRGGVAPTPAAGGGTPAGPGAPPVPPPPPPPPTPPPSGRAPDPEEPAPLAYDPNAPRADQERQAAQNGNVTQGRRDDYFDHGTAGPPSPQKLRALVPPSMRKFWFWLRRHFQDENLYLRLFEQALFKGNQGRIRSAFQLHDAFTRTPNKVDDANREAYGKYIEPLMLSIYGMDLDGNQRANFEKLSLEDINEFLAALNAPGRNYRILQKHAEKPYEEAKEATQAAENHLNRAKVELYDLKRARRLPGGKQAVPMAAIKKAEREVSVNEKALRDKQKAEAVAKLKVTNPKVPPLNQVGASGASVSDATTVLLDLINDPRVSAEQLNTIIDQAFAASQYLRDYAYDEGMITKEVYEALNPDPAFTTAFRDVRDRLGLMEALEFNNYQATFPNMTEAEFMNNLFRSTYMPAWDENASESWLDNPQGLDMAAASQHAPATIFGNEFDEAQGRSAAQGLATQGVQGLEKMIYQLQRRAISNREMSERVVNHAMAMNDPRFAVVLPEALAGTMGYADAGARKRWAEWALKKARALGTPAAGTLVNSWRDAPIVRVKRGEKEIAVVILDKKYASNLLRHYGTMSKNPVAKAFYRTSLTVRRLLTTLNPDFIAGNAPREWVNAILQVPSAEGLTKEQGKAIARRLMNPAEYARWNRLVWKYSSTRRGSNAAFIAAATSPEDKLLREFVIAAAKAGLFTTPYHGGTLEELREEMEREHQRLLDKAAGPMSPRQLRNALRLVGRALDKAASTTENAPRAAVAYHVYQKLVADIPANLTPAQRAEAERRAMAQAARAGQNISVNFKKYGIWGRKIGKYFFFFNPAVQGSARSMRAYGFAWSLPVRLAIYGAMMRVINEAIGGDDDEGRSVYETKVPDWVRERNLVILIPGGDGEYFSVPLPFGHNATFAVGEKLASAFLGHEDQFRGLGEELGDEFKNLAALAFSSFTPIPMGPGTAGNPLAVITPSMLQPFEELAVNLDWRGMPIQPKEYGNAPNALPDSWQVKDADPDSTAETMFRMLAASLNAITGGDQYHPGMIDIHPAQLQHLFESYSGAAGTVMTRTMEAVNHALLSEYGDAVRSTPVIRKFYGLGESRFDDRGRYFELQERMVQLEAQRKAITLSRDKEKLEAFMALEEGYWDKGVIGRYHGTERRVRRMSRDRSQLLRIPNRTPAQTARIEWLDEHITESMRQFNQYYFDRIVKEDF